MKPIATNDNKWIVEKRVSGQAVPQINGGKYVFTNCGLTFNIEKHLVLMLRSM